MKGLTVAQLRARLAQATSIEERLRIQKAIVDAERRAGAPAAPAFEPGRSRYGSVLDMMGRADA